MEVCDKRLNVGVWNLVITHYSEDRRCDRVRKEGSHKIIFRLYSVGCKQYIKDVKE